MWKRKKTKVRRYKNPEQLPLVPTKYPVGIALVTSKGMYRIGSDGKRYRILTKNILNSWNFPIVTVTTESALAKYPVAVTKLGFRDGTLLNNIADGKLYLASDSKLRHITSPEILHLLGISRDDAVTVSDAEIKIMKVGEELY